MTDCEMMTTFEADLRACWADVAVAAAAEVEEAERRVAEAEEIMKMAATAETVVKAKMGVDTMTVRLDAGNMRFALVRVSEAA